MKRVLILNNEFPPIGAGAGTASCSFARHLAKLGHEVTVLTAGYGNLPLLEERDGVLIRRLPCLRKRPTESTAVELLSYTAVAIRHLLGTFRNGRERYDTSLCFHALPAGIIGYVLRKTYGIPYVVLLRGGDVPGFLPERFRLHHILTAPLTRVVWRNARHIVANSNGLRALAERTAHRLGKPVHVVPNGVDLTAVPQGEPASGDGSGLRMIYVGRLDRQKGLEYLIEALALLPVDLRERVHLRLIGDGPERHELERKVALLGSSHVTFLGHLAHEEVWAHLRRSDLFVLPSLYEGMSNSLLEAMAAGLPALVTDIMGNNELVCHRKNGILFPPRDPASIFRAVAEVLERPSLLHRFRANALDRVQSMDWAHVTRTLNLYIEIGTLPEPTQGMESPSCPPGVPKHGNALRHPDQVMRSRRISNGWTSERTAGRRKGR